MQKEGIGATVKELMIRIIYLPHMPRSEPSHLIITVQELFVLS